MKKFIFNLIIGLFVSQISTLSQKINSHAILSMGGTYNNNESTMTFTVGELTVFNPDPQFYVLVPAFTVQQDFTTSVNENTQKNIQWRLLQNPVRDYLTIQNNENTTNLSQISIHSITGQFIMKQNIENKNYISLDVSNLKKGIYLVQLNGITSYTLKFIKE